MTDEIFLNEREAAKLLRITPRTLQRWRVDPPPNPVPYIRLGRQIRYNRQAIMDWAQRSLETGTND